MRLEQIQELDKRGLAYIQLVRYNSAFDPNKRGTEMDVLSTFRPLIKKTPVFYNCGLTATEAEDWISQGLIDCAVFGRDFLTTPDLPQRLFKGLDLNPPQYATFYGGGNPDRAVGYTDYPTA